MKIAGVVIDGGIRDATGIRRAGLPVFARNLISPQGALKDGLDQVKLQIGEATERQRALQAYGQRKP